MAKANKKNGLIWSFLVVIAGVVGIYEHLPYAPFIVIAGLLGVAFTK